MKLFKIILSFSLLWASAALAQPVTTKPPINMLVAPCTAVQLLYGGGAGLSPQCLNLGTNLSITTGTLNAAGGSGSPGGSNTQVQYNNSGVFGGITGATTNGTALTLVAPVLGTPASGTVTNLTGTASININGTVGATTPSTVAATSIVVPTRTGGSAAGSTASLNGTSNGSPASAFVNLQSNGQSVSIGNTSPKANLDINANLSSSPALAQAGSLQRIQAIDTVISGTEWDSYGSLGNFLTGAVASGTSASPTASASGLSMFNLSGWGYNGTSFQKGAIIALQSDSLWSGTNQATHIDFYTTPTTSTTLTQIGRMHPSGGFSIGNITDPGIGTISANVKFTAAGNAGLSVTKTVRAAGGAADCTLIFTGGLLTGGTC